MNANCKYVSITHPTANVDAPDRASEFVIPIIVIMMITIFNLVTIQNGYKVSLISKLTAIAATFLENIFQIVRAIVVNNLVIFKALHQLYCCDNTKHSCRRQ